MTRRKGKSMLEKMREANAATLQAPVVYTSPDINKCSRCGGGRVNGYIFHEIRCSAPPTPAELLEKYGSPDAD